MNKAIAIDPGISKCGIVVADIKQKKRVGPKEERGRTYAKIRDLHRVVSSQRKI